MTIVLLMSKSINSCPNRQFVTKEIFSLGGVFSHLFLWLHDILNNYKHILQKSWYYLFACSGGADSMVATTIMLNYLHTIWINKDRCIILHFHHAQRSASDFEYEYLKSFFCDYIYISGTFYWDWFGVNESILRKARRQFFRSVLSQYFDSVIILGHHKIDSIITMMLNQKRWSWSLWIQWLSIYEHRTTYCLDYGIFRPLLWLSKNQIYTIIETLWIPYREDVTNFAAKNSRSFLYNNHLQWLSDSVLHFFDTSCTNFQQVSTSVCNSILSLVSKPKEVIYYIWLILDYYLFVIDDLNRFLRDLLKYMEWYHHINKQTFKELEYFFTSKWWWNYYHQWIYFWKHQSKLYIIRWKKDFWKYPVITKIDISGVLVWQFLYNVFTNDSWLLYSFVVLNNKYSNKDRYSFTYISNTPLQKFGFPIDLEKSIADGRSVSWLTINYKGKNTTLFKYLSKCGIPFFIKPYCCVIYKHWVPCFVLFPSWVCR